MSSRVFIIARLAELHLKSNSIPSFATDRLDAVVERERLKLLAQYEAKREKLFAQHEAKLRAFVAKTVTLKSVGKAIGDGPLPPVAAPATPPAPIAPSTHTSAGGAQ